MRNGVVSFRHRTIGLELCFDACIDLGRSSDMLATDDEAGNAIITLSYWKSMQHLHEFAQSPVHRSGWEWFDRTTKTHPHLSMMHEVYALPKGHWENIYTNFTPFGMGEGSLLSDAK